MVMDLKKVYLDLGMHNCEGLRHFIEMLSIDESWIIHSFEPNPKLNGDCITKLPNVNVQLHRSAVWVNDGDHVFKMFGNEGLSQGGYLEPIGDRRYSDYHSETIVSCVNLIEFLKQFDETHELYIKMDIEWAEYTILPELLKSGWPSNIKKLWVEWHGQHFNEFIDKAKKIKTDIKETTDTQLFDWI